MNEEQITISKREYLAMDIACRKAMEIIAGLTETDIGEVALLVVPHALRMAAAMSPNGVAKNVERLLELGVFKPEPEPEPEPDRLST